MTPDIPQIRTLWLAVIWQAIRDSKKGVVNAHRWFSLENEDFIDVCHLAGIDAKELYRLLKR